MARRSRLPRFDVFNVLDDNGARRNPACVDVHGPVTVEPPQPLWRGAHRFH